ncbi:MAG: hypothetical protein M1835_002234 [Candelina submexicana]|nr:MAG: hypothetical protein M1835_002234 [Candelina submexicana]
MAKRQKLPKARLNPPKRDVAKLSHTHKAFAPALLITLEDIQSQSKGTIIDFPIISFHDPFDSASAVVLFSSRKTPQPFLDPTLMERRIQRRRAMLETAGQARNLTRA